MRQTLLIIGIITSITASVNGQSKVDFSGYMNDMQTVYLLEDNNWIWENQVHRRLNFDYYPASWLKITLQERTRFLQGNSLRKFPGYEQMFGLDGGWADLSFAQAGEINDSTGYVYASMIDRAYAEFTLGDFVATIGRQRINWGQTFVWNPNDIFNTYSYFDVDYPERPGSDGIRLQYYTSMTSSFELAAKIDSSDKITAAYYCRFNAGSYDLQFLGGVLAEQDLVLGTGWSGNLWNTSFRGEASYFRDLESFKDTTGSFLISVGLDHTFANSLFLQTEVLYSGFAKDLDIYNFMQLFSQNMSIKNLGFTEWSIFGNISYPVHPLVNASMAGMYFPDWKGFYFGPSLEISMTNNLKTSLIFQGFSAELKNLNGITERQNTFIGYARIKWSF